MARLPAPGRAPGQAAPIQAPEIEDWGDDDALPSLAVAGLSGSGKTYAIGRLLASGLKLAVADVENKLHVLRKYKPPYVNFNAPVVAGPNKRPPSASEKYQRIMRFIDALGTGKYHVHNGEPIHGIAVDSLLELADTVHMHRRATTDRQKSLIMWEDIGIDLVNKILKPMRDAAGYAAAKRGMRPLMMLLTVGCERMVDGMGNVIGEQPLLPGKKALKWLPYQFELVWHLRTTVENGEHLFEINTVSYPGIDCKSPPGVLDKVYQGRGVHIDGQPDVASLFAKVLSDPSSPYYNADIKLDVPSGTT